MCAINRNAPDESDTCFIVAGGFGCCHLYCIIYNIQTRSVCLYLDDGKAKFRQAQETLILYFTESLLKSKTIKLILL